MAKTEVLIGGKKISLNYKMLLALAENAESAGEDLVAALLGLNIPSISEAVLQSCLLDAESMDALWQDKKMDLREALLKESEFRQGLTDDQARDIMESGDLDLLYILAANCEDLYLEEDEQDEDYPRRLSDKTREKLMASIAQHADPGIRLMLAENASAPDELLLLLAKDAEPDVAGAAEMSLLHLDDDCECCDCCDDEEEDR